MANKLVYCNETGLNVSIHPSTIHHGCEVDMSVIKPSEQRVFTLPEGTYPHIKMITFGGSLHILISPQRENHEDKFHQPIDIHQK